MLANHIQLVLLQSSQDSRICKRKSMPSHTNECKTKQTQLFHTFSKVEKTVPSFCIVREKPKLNYFWISFSSIFKIKFLIWMNKVKWLTVLLPTMYAFSFMQHRCQPRARAYKNVRTIFVRISRLAYENIGTPTENVVPSPMCWRQHRIRMSVK